MLWAPRALVTCWTTLWLRQQPGYCPAATLAPFMCCMQLLLAPCLLHGMQISSIFTGSPCGGEHW